MMIEKESGFDNSKWGENPGGPESIPGLITIDEIPGNKNLEVKATDKLRESPQILEMARKKGQDIIAYSSRHGKVIAIGVGIAGLATLIGGIILYVHSVKKEK